MHIYDLPHDGEGLVAFEVRSAFLWRSGACAVARAIPNVVMIYEEHGGEFGKRDDEFCEFELAGVRFIISEPFSDRSRYWVGPQPVRRCPQIDEVRAVFERSTWLGRLLGRLLVRAG